jgi:hypothetical protein
MRAREFTINIPICIKINGDGDPEVSMDKEEDPAELHQNPVMVPPLQQHMELTKAEHGKNSPVIDKLTQDHPTIGQEPDVPSADTSLDDQIIQKIKSLISQ